MRKFLKAYSDLILDLTMLNIELVQAIFIYYNVFQFHVPRSITFLSYHAITHTHTHTHKHGHTHTHTHSSDKYSIVAFSKNATITTPLTDSLRDLII